MNLDWILLNPALILFLQLSPLPYPLPLQPITLNLGTLAGTLSTFYLSLTCLPLHFQLVLGTSQLYQKLISVAISYYLRMLRCPRTLYPFLQFPQNLFYAVFVSIPLLFAWGQTLAQVIHSKDTFLRLTHS